MLKIEALPDVTVAGHREMVVRVAVPLKLEHPNVVLEQRPQDAAGEIVEATLRLPPVEHSAEGYGQESAVFEPVSLGQMRNVACQRMGRFPLIRSELLGCFV
jgi:hypothetical protein